MCRAKNVYAGTGFTLFTALGNSGSDPFSAFGTQKPMYWTQIRNLYREYYVRGSKFIVEAVARTGTDSLEMVLLPNAATSPFTTIAQMREVQYNKRKIVAQAVGGNNKKVLASYMSTDKIIGRKGTRFDDEYWANMDQNPASQWYWQLGLQPTAGLAEVVVDLYFTVIVYCQVRFLNVLPPGEETPEE